MAEIKRILQIKQANKDFSNRQIDKIVNCSKDTVKAILSSAASLSITYYKIKEMNEEEVHNLFYSNNNPYQNVPEPDVDYYIKELKKKHVSVLLLWKEYIEKYPNELNILNLKNGFE